MDDDPRCAEATPLKPLLQFALLISMLAAIAAPSAVSAHAHLIDDGPTTIDTDAGLEWLDVTATQGRSWTQISLGFGGYLADGYHLADRFEVCGLLRSLGDSLPNCTNLASNSPDLVSSSTAATFNALLGTTFDARATGTLGSIQGLSFASGELGFVRIIVEEAASPILSGVGGNFDSSSNISGFFLARPWPTPVCTYGPCDATVCNTSGMRHPNNSPCEGPEFLSCSAPPCPTCVYGPCSTFLCNTTGIEVAANQPCIGPTSQTCSAPVCPACVYSACDAVCGEGNQAALNQPCTGEVHPTCNLQACGNGDFDGDGLVDEADRDLLVQALGSSDGDSRYLAAADMDADQTITLVDYQFWIGAYRTFLAEPAGSGSLQATAAASGAVGPTPVPVMGRRWLGLLLLASLGCAVYRRARRRSRA